MEANENSNELRRANKALALEIEEKKKRAAELLIANKELAFQNEEKEKRAAELIIANKELVFQMEEKEKGAAELAMANKELAYQNDEKEKRAAELRIAMKELSFQNEEKEKRANELIFTNKELAYQIEEKEKREAELVIAHKELQAFTYISSHDLQEPLRKIQTFAGRILEKEYQTLSEDGKDYFRRMQISAERMQQLILDLLVYSRINTTKRDFQQVDLSILIEEVKAELKTDFEIKRATIEINQFCNVKLIVFEFRQLLHNLISNALKFSNPDKPPHIVISCKMSNRTEIKNLDLQANKEYAHIEIKDNGLGFDPAYSERIFEVFQKLHSSEEYKGTGIGLAIVKKIVENHKGTIMATGRLGEGAKFDIFIPQLDL